MRIDQKWLLCLTCLVAACGPSEPSGSCATTADCPLNQDCVDGRCAPRRDGSSPRMDAAADAGRPPMLTAIAIVPADPIVNTIGGAPASVDLEIEATYDDGSTSVVDTGFWSVADTLLGSTDTATGVYTANGAVAGSVVVTVEALAMMATTTLTVTVEHSVIVNVAPTDAADQFAAAGAPVDDPARATNLLYPGDGTAFPQNVFPADIQWEGGVDGDLYRVTLSVRGVDVNAYALHSGAAFTYDWLVDRTAWRALAESAPEESVVVRVDRLEAASGQVITGVPRTIRFADAVIRGAIYYWDLGGGRIQRIRGDGTGLESFMPNPPARPSDGRRCVACHAVSRDGTRMAAELWDGGDYGAIFDLTADLSGDPAPTVVPPTQQRFLSASFSPDNSRLIANSGNGLFLMDGNTGGRPTTTGTPLPTAAAAHPTWSPDGTAIAFVTNTNGGWAVDFTRGDLALIDVTGADAFGPQRTIFTGGALTVARPSWSPDSSWLAIQYSQHSRAFEDVAVGPSVRREGSIQMVSRDGATVSELTALNGGATNSYYPTFSPFDEGGYYWLAFFSTRDYGNAQVGTRGTGRRQLWVAAVSSSPGAADPSNTAYWLPQQDVSRQNMAAFWAEEACLADGRTCAASGECCSGFCRDTGGGPVCVPPDTVPCSMVGEACSIDADCCEGEGTCVANRCSTLM